MKKVALLTLCIVMLTAMLAGCTAAPAVSPSPDASGAAVSPAPTTEDTQPATSPAATSEVAADGSWDYIKDKGEFIIGLDDTFAPMGFREKDGTLVGFDIDLANAVCKQLGVKAKFQPIDWDAKDMELSTKKIDCIWNGMSITPERQKSMSMTKGYLNNRIVLMCNKDVTVGSVEDLKGKNVGTQAESSALEMLQGNEIYAEIKDKVKEYKSYDDCILDMDTGRIDVMVVDEVLAIYKNENRAEGKKLVQAPVALGDDLYAVGFRKADVELTAKVQAAINAVVESGEAKTMSEKWFFGKDLLLK